MILDERGRWFAFFLLDSLRGGKVRKYYDEIRKGYREGTSVRETEQGYLPGTVRRISFERVPEREGEPRDVHQRLDRDAASDHSGPGQD